MLNHVKNTEHFGMGLLPIEEETFLNSIVAVPFFILFFDLCLYAQSSGLMTINKGVCMDLEPMMSLGSIFEHRSD